MRRALEERGMRRGGWERVGRERDEERGLGEVGRERDEESGLGEVGRERDEERVVRVGREG